MTLSCVPHLPERRTLLLPCSIAQQSKLIGVGCRESEVLESEEIALPTPDATNTHKKNAER